MIVSDFLVQKALELMFKRSLEILGKVSYRKQRLLREYCQRSGGQNVDGNVDNKVKKRKYGARKRISIDN